MRHIPYTFDEIFARAKAHPGNYPGASPDIASVDFSASIDAEGLNTLTNGTNTNHLFSFDSYHIAGWVPANPILPHLIMGWLTASVPVNPQDQTNRESFELFWLHDVAFTSPEITINDTEVLREVAIASFVEMAKTSGVRDSIAARLADRDLAMEATTSLWSRIKRAVG